MNVISPTWLRSTEFVRCGMSTRSGGVSPPPRGLNLSYSVGDDEANVRTNRLLFFGFLGIDPDRIAVPKQVHGSTVRRANEPGSYPECDALVTNVPGVYLCVTIADCVPLFLVDPEKKTVAVVHAGWRGSAAGVTTKAIEALTHEFGSKPESLLAYIGPAAGACCYAVGDEVARSFDERFLHHNDKMVYLDLKAVNLHQLVQSGVPPVQIEISPHCTISDAGLFHSHRRDGKRSGRMMGVIGIVPL